MTNTYSLEIPAAFLSSLHSNIFIELDSPVSTPNSLYPTCTETLPSPFTSSMSSLTDADVAPPASLKIPDPATTESSTEGAATKPPTVDEDGIPILSTFPADDDDARAEGLHIIADSVAQQRNIASRSIIFHPITFAVFAAVVAVLKQLFYDSATTDLVRVMTTLVGVVMAMLGAIRLVCGPYIFEAERVGTWKWLDQGRSTEEEEQTGLRVLGTHDEVLLTKFGDEFIAAIIYRGVQPLGNPGSPNGKKSRRTPSSSKQTRMVIRGWSVKQKYRRKEVGTALLEDAIKLAKAKGWTADGVEFAEDHANHKRPLPAIFNGPLDKFITIANNALEKKVQELGLVQEKGRKRK